MKSRKNLFLGALSGFVLAWALAVTIFAFAPSKSPGGVAHAAEGMNDSALEAALLVQEAFREISARVMPAIVEISVQAQTLTLDDEGGEIPWNDFFSDPSEESQAPRYFRSQGLGSGVIITSDGDTRYVLTNAHVIGTSPEKISIELYSGEMVDAVLVGIDERKDLALVQFTSEDSNLRPVKTGDSDQLYVGDWVLAYGSPYGYEQSASYGIVSALGRRDGPGENINDFIQTDAAINQGNSGGALVNIRGELVGINTFITTPNGGSIGLGFAIPVNNALSSVKQLIESGEVRYGWLGVSLGAYGIEAAESLGYPAGNGALVYQIFEGSPAWNANLKPGDLITHLDGKPVEDPDHLIYRLGDKPPGDEALFSVNRLGDEIELTATMGERSDEESIRTLHNLAHPGFVAAPLTPDLAEAMNLEEAACVPVAEVYPRTVAQMADLRPGDVIIAIGEYEVVDLKSMYYAISKTDHKSPVFTILRDGERIVLSVSEGVQP